MNSKVFYLAWPELQMEVSPAKALLLQGEERVLHEPLAFQMGLLAQTHRAMQTYIPQILDIYCFAPGAAQVLSSAHG